MASLSLEEIQRSKSAQTLQSPCPSGRAAFPKRAHPRGSKLRRLHCNSRRDITSIHYLLQPALGGVHYLPGRLPALRTRAASAPRGLSCPCSPAPARTVQASWVGRGMEQPPSLRVTIYRPQYRPGEERVTEMAAGVRLGVGGEKC